MIHLRLSTIHQVQSTICGFHAGIDASDASSFIFEYGLPCATHRLSDLSIASNPSIFQLSISPVRSQKKKLDKTLIWLCWTPLLLLFQKTSSALCHAPLPLAPLFSQALIQALAAKRFGPNFSCKRCHSHPKLCWHHVTQANVSTPAVCLCLMPKV